MFGWVVDQGSVFIGHIDQEPNHFIAGYDFRKKQVFSDDGQGTATDFHAVFGLLTGGQLTENDIYLYPNLLGLILKTATASMIGRVLDQQGFSSQSTDQDAISLTQLATLWAIECLNIHIVDTKSKSTQLIERDIKDSIKSNKLKDCSIVCTADIPQNAQTHLSLIHI